MTFIYCKKSFKINGKSHHNHFGEKDHIRRIIRFGPEPSSSLEGIEIFFDIMEELIIQDLVGSLE